MTGRLKYGRYFVLNGPIDEVYEWLDSNSRGDYSIYFCGMCPVEESLVLSAVFEIETDMVRFETEFLKGRGNHIPVLLTRRQPRFDWPSDQERRGNPDRRMKINRRTDGRKGGRREVDFSDVPQERFVASAGARC